MPRRARVISSTSTYHVVIKGADNQLMFENKKDYEKYIEILEYYKEKLNFDLYAYCLMSNHVHLLIHHQENTTISTIFRHINTSYAGWFNMKYKRNGYLQDGRFYSEPVENRAYLMNVVRYIHYNPVNAGLENKPGEKYIWSSFREYLGKCARITDINKIFEIFESQNYFFDFHTRYPEEECLDIHKVRVRIPDDVARDIIKEVSCCETATDFQRLSILERNTFIPILHKKGISTRQLNRLTGTPRGVIERLLKNK